MTWPAYDPLTAAWNWLRSLAGLLTEPGSPFWWPTLVVALVAFGVLGLATRASLREMRAQAMPVTMRAFLRQAAEDLGLFLVNSAIPFLLAPAYFLLSSSGAAISVALSSLLFGLPQAGGAARPPAGHGLRRADPLRDHGFLALLDAPAVPSLRVAVARAPAAP